MTRLLRWAPRALALMLAAVAVVALVAPRNSWFVLPVAVVWFATAAALLLRLVGRPVADRLGAAVRRHPRVAVAAGTLVGGTLAAVHAWLAYVPFGWDAKGVLDGASRIAAGSAFTESDWEYFARYPNNISLAFLESLVIDVGVSLGLTAVTAVVSAQVAGFGVLLWCVGSVLVLLDRHAAVLPVQGLTTVLLGLNANLAVPYSDFTAAALVAVALWASVLAWSGRRPLWWVLALLAMVLAVSIKAYTVALPLGLLALLPAVARRVGRFRSALVVVGVLVTLAAGVTAVQGTAKQVTGLTDDLLVRYDPGIPPMHFLALGTYDSQQDSPTRRYGGWSKDHVAETRSVKDPEARERMLRAKVVRQVTERGVAGNVRFFTTKVAWTWGDGTFWAHGEGPDGTREPRLADLAGELQEWFIGSGEPYRTRTAGVVQGVWISTLLATAAVAWRRRDHPWVVVCSLTLLTLTAYLTLFESRPRYLVALLPVLLVLTGLGGGDRSPGLVSRPALRDLATPRSAGGPAS